MNIIETAIRGVLILKSEFIGTESIWGSQIEAGLIQDAGWEWRPAWMPRAYSLDLRERVVAAVTAGESCREVARTFKVSVASVVKWSQRFRATGSAAAKPVGGVRRNSLRGQRDWLVGADRGPRLT